ncbi:MAG TPA: restriction endonuclease subunit S [Anaerolineales bacterium]|nr:restriction endonuclease subunit S [Anaerolineales bacterium]
MSVRQFRPYPDYRGSGVEWLGEIPAHWEVKRLKHLSSVDDESLPEDTDPELEIIYVDIGNVDASAGIAAKERYSFSTAPSRARRVVRHGDVIVSTVRTYLKAIAAIVDPEPNLVVSTGFAVIRPRLLDFRFAAYALRAPYFVDRVVAHSVGVSYPTINATEMACFPIVFPALEEQHAIAAFLDRETSKIDALVAKKERLIELLQEKRAALISHAVTKGLDPNASMKDSGVEWLGEIPEDWEVRPLKRLASLRAGAAITAESIEEYGDYPVFGGNGIRGYTSSYTHEGRFPLIGRQGALCGCVNLASGRFWASEHAVVATPRSEVDSHCLAYLLHAMSLNSYSQSAAQPGLAIETISPLPVPMPRTGEQRAIADFLDRETSKIDALVAKVREGIERLKEYRTALISAAVTGKIDVREPGHSGESRNPGAPA